MLHLPKLRSAFAALAAQANRRLVNSAAAGTQAAGEELPRPSYTYQSPGSSLHDPTYNGGDSVANASYIEYDPKPKGSTTKSHTRDGRAPTSASTKAAISAAEAAMSRATRAQQQQQEAAPGTNPAYVYQSPGSSLHEASYGFSAKDPVYFVDPAPAAGKQASNSSSSGGSSGSKQQRVVQEPPAGKVRKGLPKDDYANAPYVHNSRTGSMSEPHYVSITDPQDKPPKKK